MDALQELISTSEYVVLTFATTTRALKAEKALKNGAATFVTIPTPREVSTSCGISVKLHPRDKYRCEQLLNCAGVEIGGIYKIAGHGKNSCLTPLTPEYQLPA